MNDRKRLFTGLQPSGVLHIGNYFGALKPFVDMHVMYDSYLAVVDLHALTTTRNPSELRENIYGIVKDYVAAGVDPDTVVLFKQSDVPEHTELAWIFECLVTVPFLMQSHAYKDKVARGLEANAGLFNYPMLMAADILLYDSDEVPVGEDQRQHIEYAREAAYKFNSAYGDTFIAPKERILNKVGVIPGTDGKKMSKSYKNIIPLFAPREDIAKAVMSIVTDSSGEHPENVYAIHTLFRDKAELDALYEEKKGRYKELKEALIDDIDAYFAPMREKRATITDADVRAILECGAQKAREHASAKMEEVRHKVGISLT